MKEPHLEVTLAAAVRLHAEADAAGLTGELAERSGGSRSAFAGKQIEQRHLVDDEETSGFFHNGLSIFDFILITGTRLKPIQLRIPQYFNLNFYARRFEAAGNTENVILAQRSLEVMEEEVLRYISSSVDVWTLVFTLMCLFSY